MTNNHTPHSIDAIGHRVARQLDLGTEQLPHDIAERLRAARTRAVAARLVVAPQLQTAHGVSVQNGVGLLHLGDEGLTLWSRLASFLPLIALVAGLFCLQQIMDDNRADELAEVDAALLTDDLPPSAYADPGFLQFLKVGEKFLSTNASPSATE